MVGCERDHPERVDGVLPTRDCQRIARRVSSRHRCVGMGDTSTVAARPTRFCFSPSPSTTHRRSRNFCDATVARAVVGRRWRSIRPTTTLGKIRLLTVWLDGVSWATFSERVGPSALATWKDRGGARRGEGAKVRRRSSLDGGHPTFHPSPLESWVSAVVGRIL